MIMAMFIHLIIKNKICIFWESMIMLIDGNLMLCEGLVKGLATRNGLLLLGFGVS